MLLPLTVSWFCKIQIGLTFLVPAHPGSPGQRVIKWLCVLLRWYLMHLTSGSPLTKSSSSRSSTLTRCSPVDIIGELRGLVTKPTLAPPPPPPAADGPASATVPGTWVADSWDGVLAGRGSVENSSSLPCIQPASSFSLVSHGRGSVENSSSLPCIQTASSFSLVSYCVSTAIQLLCNSLQI